MCLTVDKNFTSYSDAIAYKGEKLKEDLIVYKSLIKGDKGYKAPVYYFRYERGFHYYQTGKKFSKVARYFRNGIYRLNINTGLHAFTRERDAKNHWWGNVVVEMIIPKGSTVFYGLHQDVVTDNLIFPHYKKAKK